MQISILLFLLVILTYLLILLRKNKWINKTLTFFIIIGMVQWYYIPIILTICGANAVIDLINGNILADVYSLMIKEVIFIIVILGLLLFGENGKKIKLVSVKLAENDNLNTERILFVVSAVTIVINTIYILTYRMDYNNNNDINQQQGGVFQMVSIFVNFFISYLWVYYIYESQKSPVKKLIVIFLIGLYSIIVIMAGSRIYFLNFFLLIAIPIIKSKNVLIKMRQYITLIIVLAVSLIMLPILASKRVGAQDDSSSSISRSILLVPEQLNIKLNSFSYSDILLKYDGPGFAGFNPYVGSVMKFVPRFIWNDKPTATSFNSTVDGIPSRRIPHLQGVKSDAYNVGVSAFAVSFWQMGYLTVFLAIFINVLFLKYISRALNHGSYIIKSIGFMLIGFPQLIMIPTYGDNIIQNMELAFITIFILLLFNILKLKKNENYRI